MTNRELTRIINIYFSTCAVVSILGNDGFYYFTGVVEPDKYTDYLLESVSLKENAVAPENGNLEVNVLADAVQADVSKVNQAWNTPKDANGNQIYAE